MHAYHLLTSVDPDVSAAVFSDFAQLDAMERGGRSRRHQESLGSFVMAALATKSPELHQLAHQYFDLALYCLELLSMKHAEAFLISFYEGPFLLNTTAEVQKRFFDSSVGSYGDQQLALILLQRKFGMGPGMSMKMSSVKAQADVIPSILKLGKSKFSFNKDADLLILASFYALLRPLLSPTLSTIPFGEGTRIPWITVDQLDRIRALLTPVVLEKNSLKWSPFLVPYRVLLGRKDIEVVALSSGSASGDENGYDCCRVVVEID